MNYLWDERFHLFRRATVNEFAYSDGAEARLLGVVSQAKDRGTFSPELAEAISDWPSEYHLSRGRHCLVRPLRIRAGDTVLELGCGCGAVTRYLGEIGANVVAVEGSLARAQVAAERSRDLANVRVFVDDLLRFDTQEAFDWVLLIGVLEYAAMFSTSENPFEHYLRSVSRFRAPGGRVVVAIENKLGLKYFNGCSEDHVRTPYFGIQDLYGPRTPRTFGRKELVAQLTAAGLPSTYFYYPFPDYKLPSVVLADDALTDPDFDSIDLIARCQGRDYSGSPYRGFDEALAFAAVGENGLLADLSNSFLAVATPEAESAIQASELATAFSYYRASQFVTQTRFVRSGSKIEVLKEHLVPWSGDRSIVTESMTISNRPVESAYRAGRQIIWRLLRARALSGELEPAVEALRPWMEFLLRNIRMATGDIADLAGQPPSLASYVLPGDFLDCTPFNLLESGGELASIDFEWCADRDVPFGWVVTRGVLWSLTSGMPSADHLQSATVVIVALCKKFGLTVSESNLEVWLQQEAGFQTMATGRPHHALTTNKTSSGLRSIVGEIASLSQTVAARDEQVASLSQTVAVRDEQIAVLSQEVAARDKQIVSFTRTVAARGEQVAARDERIASLNQEVAARGEQIVNFTRIVAARDEQVAARDERIASLNQEVTARGEQIAELDREVARRKEQMAGLDKEIARRTEQMAGLDKEIARRTEQINQNHARIADLEQRLLAARTKLSSFSWRITKPLRSLGSAFPRTAQLSQKGAKVAYWTLTLQLPRRLRQRKVARQLLDSGLFDPVFYLAQYPDVAEAGINPLSHYLSHGVVEGHKPNLYFDTAFYLQQNPDVAASGVNPLLHYLLDGFREGREPSREFNGRLYLEQNADVAASGMNPLGHFLKYGRSEGRAVPISGHCTEAGARQLLDSGLFDPVFYLAQYPDVAEAGIDPLSHYLSHGAVEGWRKPNLYFDTAFYLQQNPDVAASGVNPLLHYLLDGFREGREPSREFNGRLYLEQNADVAASGMNPLGHFLKCGRSEGRAVPISGHCTEAGARQLLDSGLFDPVFYLAQYPDVAEAGIDPLSHYLSHGAVEGWRKPNLYFDTAFYLQQNPDVAASGVNPLLHYLLDGFREGREPSREFNGRLYLEQNADVAASGMNPLGHFLKFGTTDRRRVPVPQPRTAEAEPIVINEVINEALAVRGDPCDRAELIRQARDGVCRTLVIDHAVPTPDMDAGSVRLFALLRLLVGLGSPVTFASDRLENVVTQIEAVQKLGVKVLVGYTEIRAHLEQWGGGYTLAILSRPETAAAYVPLVRAYAPYAEVVYDSVDLHHLRLRRAAELKNDPQQARRSEFYFQLETLGFTFADRALAITETEKQVILQRWPEAVVEVVPTVHSVYISPMPWAARKSLVFIGGYDHEPNVDAVIWFVQEVFPKVFGQISDVRFTILGSKPPESVTRLASKSVNVVGWVPDPEPYFEVSRIFVAPLRYGAGLKGKIGHAMSLGLPVVTTQIGAEGMQLADGVHALIADDADAFSAAVVRLYNDEALWNSLQRAAAAHIEKNFSDSAVHNILLRLFAPEITSAKSI